MTVPSDSHRGLPAQLADCALCPRECHVNRLAGETGFCGIGREAVVCSAGPHFGEEPPLVGAGGSGTIFFAGCNLACVFCQNYEISHYREGRPADALRLAAMMLRLQEIGCHNINVVTPTHVVAQIVEALEPARSKGLELPLVYNCGGYEKLATLQALEGTVEIYMPDAKYWSAESAERYSHAADYPEVMRAALREMQRQVGDLEIVDGIARRGLLVRHLVMPGLVEESLRILEFLRDEISPDTYVNVMPQYRPAFHAADHTEIARRPTDEEYREVIAGAGRLGLRLSG